MIVFGTVTKTISKENRNTPLLYVTFLESRKFPKHKRVPLWNPSVLWDKKFLTGSRDNPSPSFIHKLFRYQKFSEIRKVSLRTLLLLWGKTNATKNRDTPSLISNTSRYQKISEKEKSSYTKFFGPVRQKSISQQVVIIHPSTLPTPSNLKILSIPNFLQNQQRFAHEFIWYCEMKQFWRKFVTPSLLSLTISDIRFLLKHRRFSLRISSLPWDNKVWRENLDTPYSHTPS